MRIHRQDPDLSLLLYDTNPSSSSAPLIAGGIMSGILYGSEPPAGSGVQASRNHHQQQHHHTPPHHSLEARLFPPGTGPVLPIYPVLSKNHNNYATNILVDSSSGSSNLMDGSGSSSSVPSAAVGGGVASYPTEGGEMTQAGGLNVRAEEVGLVLLVLLLWAGAVALFFNRWGKIRMLEPYQPKFIDAPRGSLALPNNPVAGVTAVPLVAAATHRPSYPGLDYVHQVSSDRRLHSQNVHDE